MNVAQYLLAGLGLAVLMVIHEGGHYFAARRFGMRVTRFSIGFGPTLVRHQPKGSPTVFQIAIIPFLAYVQIAGLNPFEDVEADDQGSYANASLGARVTTIAAGSLANYVFASLLMFVGFVLPHRSTDLESMRVTPADGGPAMVAGMQRGDRILEINGAKVHDWDELKRLVGEGAGTELDVKVERDGSELHVRPFPAKDGPRAGMIMVSPHEIVRSLPVGQAATRAVTDPPKVVFMLVKGLARTIAGKEKPELSGPVGIVKETAAAVRSGAGDAFLFLGMLSAYLGGFNLLPIPALDGGRLLFLLFEAASRRKPDAKVETGIHAVGLIMMLALIAVVTWTEIMPKH